MYTEINYNNSLYHHGIKGQKWGVRRFQNEDGSLTAAGKERYLKDLPYKTKGLGDYFNTWNDLDPQTKVKVIEAGAYLAATVGISLYGKYKYKKEKQKCDDLLNDMYENRTIKSKKDLPKLDKPMSAEESMKIVNPGYPDEKGTTENCMLCTNALIMREKGYDVTAKKLDGGLYSENVNEFFPESANFKKVKTNNRQKFIDTLLDEGPGAYGNLTVKWALGGGHSVFWKNDNGKIRIFDGQSGEEYDVSNPKKSSFLKCIYVNQSEYCNVSNVEPNDKILGVLDIRKDNTKITKESKGLSSSEKAKLNRLQKLVDSGKLDEDSSDYEEYRSLVFKDINSKY